MSTTTTELRVDFFDWLFGDAEGYICLATAEPENARRTFKQKFFHWPSQRENLVIFCNEFALSRNLWFCVNLLSQPERKKEYCINHNLVWADLDTCNPELVEPKPSLIINSSPGRYQALWKIDQVVPATVAEDYSKRIAYHYKQNGADPSGWDLTQLLRVPFSTNFKYGEHPLVTLNPGGNAEVPVLDFEDIEQAPIEGVSEELQETPDLKELPESQQIVYKYQAWLERSFYELYETEPDTDMDWSARMWKLINICFEVGMEVDEVYAVALTAKCNKYLRDNRPMRFLWIEILKAKGIQDRIDKVAGEWQPLFLPQLVDSEMVEHDTFIDRYFDWASNVTDAVPEYHELCAAIILSATLADNVRLDVSYDTIVPNLWGLVLGESTLTRKTTAMLLAMKMIQDVDPEANMANDGTAEGLLTGLSMRPGRVSIFYKDEVSGFFDAINNKRYLAGVFETLTHLYDSPQRYTRMLSKSEIVIQSPVFIFFGGGIAERTFQALTESDVLSGFLPRFLVVNGNADLDRIKPTGPKDFGGMAAREKLVNELLDMKEQYMSSGYMVVAGQRVAIADSTNRPMTNAMLSPDAWETYANYEMQMVKAAHESSYRDRALPTFERLSRNIMKLAILLAASRQEPASSTFNVEKSDIDNAARFIQEWGKYSVELILNVGKTQSLRMIEKVRGMIGNKPGILKSELMRMTHLSSREMADVLATLTDRGEIIRKVPKNKARSEQFWMVH